MKRILSALTLLLLASCGGSHPKAAETPDATKLDASTSNLDEALEEIHTLFQSQSYPEAFEQASQLVESHSDSPAAQLILGKAAFYLEKDAEAEAALLAALERDPRVADAHFYLGLLAMYADKGEKAESRFSQAADLEPDNSLYWYELGKQRQRLRKLPEARTAFSKSLEVEPQGKHAASAHFSLGTIASDEDQHDDAVAEWSAALQLDKNYVDALYNLGLHHALRGDPKKALEYFAQASKLEPGDIQILSKVIQAHYRLEQYEQASSVRKQLLKVHANSKDEKVRSMKSFCFDQFVVGDERFYAYETIDKSGDLVYWYFFRISKGGKLMDKTIQLEQSAVLKEMGGGFLLGQDQEGRHSTFGRGFKELPDYPTLKATVLEAHKLTVRASSQRER